MGRASTEESLLIKSLAKQYGYTDRWARQQRQKNTQIWKDFAGGRCVPTPAMAPAAVASLAAAPNEGTDAEKATYVKNTTWQQLQGMISLLNGAMNDPSKQDTVPALARSVRESRKAWEEASKNEQAIHRAASLLVPVARVREIRIAIAPLAEMFARIRTNIAGHLEPSARPAFYAAFDASMPEWNAGIAEINHHLESLLPA